MSSPLYQALRGLLEALTAAQAAALRADRLEAAGQYARTCSVLLGMRSGATEDPLAQICYLRVQLRPYHIGVPAPIVQAITTAFATLLLRLQEAGAAV